MGRSPRRSTSSSPQGYSWSIQDGRLQILKGDSDRTELILLISTDSD